MAYVYKITSPSNKIYIGSTIDIVKRFRAYHNLSCKRQIKLYNSFVKHGVKNHCFQVLLECDKIEMYEKENYFGVLFGVIYSGGLNLRIPEKDKRYSGTSQETKDKIRKSKMGLKPNAETRKKLSLWQKGRLLTEVQKTKISIALTGKKRSIETMQRMSESRKGVPRNNGVPRPDEVRRKISESSIGKKMSIEARLKMRNKKLGGKLSEEHKRKISESLKRRSCPN